LWLSTTDPAALLVNSPIIVFPVHELTVTVEAPHDFISGILKLYVSAADATAYVDSPALPTADTALIALKGNESAQTELPLSVRSQDPPDAPWVGPWDPNVRLWASSAADYAEFSEFQVTWAASGNAVRYEVWRALEGGINGATPQTSDAQLRFLAEVQIGTFELRSDRVFGTRYSDQLPGRAPTKALYRIRSVGINGEVSTPSEIIGPVYVPDVRRPPVPNLIRVGATPTAEAERTIAAEWTQAGPTEDIRFDVFCKPANADNATPFTLAGSVPVGTAPDGVGRYRFLHADRPPGKLFAYHVVAVRETADPIDPNGTAMREIVSLPSVHKSGSAISSAPLAAPESLNASYIAASGDVQLNWTNHDEYERIEVRRKAADRFAFQVIGTIPGATESFTDPAVNSGTWIYRLLAKGVRREAMSPTDAEVVVP
jgi:hypothetical protein